MTNAALPSSTVLIQLPNGAIVKVEVTRTGRENVSFNLESNPT